MELYCEFSNFQSLYSDNLIYKCQVTDLKRVASNGRVLNIHGKHAEGKSNADVHTLTIFDQQIENFPRYLCNFFPNLKSISIIACGLKGLSKFDFIGCEGIELLMLNGNKITSLDADVFEYAHSLQHISFFDNNINYVHENTFDGLKKLKYVNFKMNSKIDRCFKENGRGKVFLDEIKSNLRMSFVVEVPDVIKITINEELCDVFMFLENFKDSTKIAVEEFHNCRMEMMFKRS